MKHDEIAMCPHIVVLGEVSLIVFRISGGRSSNVVPEEDRHVWESSWRHEFTWGAMWDFDSFNTGATFNEGVKDGDGSTEGGSLGSPNIDRVEGVFLSKATGLFISI